MTDSVLVPAGTYIVAVSGGVDSVVLLDMLASQSNVQLVVAHFDHGIRSDSQQDEAFVRQLAKNHQLPYETERVELGPNASEADARDKRYAFLRLAMQQYHAKAIITAHHQDDVIETSMINIIRGTGRHGLTALKSSEEILRPLLHVPKQQLYAYANEHGLQWREDSTNSDTKYLRNKLRHDVVAKMSDDKRVEWLALLDAMQKINDKLDIEIGNILRRGLHKNQLVLSRGWFIKLPHSIAKEVLRVLLLRAGAKEIDRKTIERLTVQIKTLAHGKVLQASGVDIVLTKRSARLQSRVVKKR